MEVKIVKTSDGSHTILHEQLDEHYHSINGAIQESKHIFINAAFKQIKKNSVSILEIGFGTGLNCFLSYIEGLSTKQTINYTGIELYPLSKSKIEQLNYADILDHKDIFGSLHQIPWEEKTNISNNFSLLKLRQNIKELNLNDTYDIVYFDAFSPKVQPDLWTFDVFKNLSNHMNNGGILTTYSAKGVVRRTLESCDLKVERIPGPPGKREMLRAIKDV